MSPVLIVGSVALDSLETPYGDAPDTLGGSAVYASLACSLFAPVRLVGVVGDDYPPEGVELLRSRGVDLAGLEVIEGGKTFRWAGRYTGSLGAAETLSTDLNVFADFSPKLPESYRETPFVFLANIQPQLQMQVLEQIAAPRLSMCDTMNLWLNTVPDQVRAMVGRVDIALMNDAEAKQLTGDPHLISAAEKTLQLGAKCSVIKKGEHGALICTEEGCRFVPPFPTTHVRDTTGAGDTFAGGMIGHLAQTGDRSTDNLVRAAAIGTVLASFCVEGLGVEGLAAATPEKMQERYAILEKSSRTPALRSGSLES
ncbi:MAG: sugar kinase [Armatimonadetes bacterium]|nr:sugar kinase [Armatimonadota bacterium]